MGRAGNRTKSGQTHWKIEQILELQAEISAKENGPLYQVVLWKWLKLRRIRFWFIKWEKLLVSRSTSRSRSILISALSVSLTYCNYLRHFHFQTFYLGFPWEIIFCLQLYQNYRLRYRSQTIHSIYGQFGIFSFLMSYGIFEPFKSFNH